MIEIIAVSVISILAFFAGWITREHVAAKRIDAILSETHKINRQQILDNILKIKIERIDGRYYVYDLDTNTFMGCGNTRPELEADLLSKYPGKTFAAEQSNLVEMGFSNDNHK